jgi:hypothetical protein
MRIGYPEEHKKQANNQAERKKAYQPRQPFRTVEGVEGAAWEKLSRNAVFVLMEFYRKFNGYNRYDLSLTYREVKNKMSNTLFSRAVWELIGYGFIDVRRFGRLERNCSLFGLSSRWRELGHHPEKLHEIEKLLKKVESLKREPGSLKKRIEISKIRNKVFNLGEHSKVKTG